jgi:hypothetical protein
MLKNTLNLSTGQTPYFIFLFSYEESKNSLFPVYQSQNNASLFYIAPTAAEKLKAVG